MLKSDYSDKKDLKALEEDDVRSFLEKQNFKKMEIKKWNFYASVPLGIKNITNGKVLALKKVYLEFDDANFKVNLYSRYHFKKTAKEIQLLMLNMPAWISSGVNTKYKAMLLQQMKSKVYEFYITETVICQILHMYSI